ncbi:hypothetical protein ACFL08_04200 [Patescibacteria group bacterium]
MIGLMIGRVKYNEVEQIPFKDWLNSFSGWLKVIHVFENWEKCFDQVHCDGNFQDSRSDEYYGYCKSVSGDCLRCSLGRYTVNICIGRECREIRLCQNDSDNVVCMSVGYAGEDFGKAILCAKEVLSAIVSDGIRWGYYTEPNG